MNRTALDQKDAPGSLRLEPQATDVVSLALVGEFDMANAADIRTEGDEALRRGNHLILDLTHATFVDSSAIAALFAVAKHATASRRVAVLQLGTAEIVETALRLSEIERVLPRASKRSDAIRVIRQLEAGEPRA